jgi:membrane protein DedA with SNARE-associated domain
MGTAMFVVVFIVSLGIAAAMGVAYLAGKRFNKLLGNKENSSAQIDLERERIALEREKVRLRILEEENKKYDRLISHPEIGLLEEN